MNLIIKDYLEAYIQTITPDEVLLLKTIFNKYNIVPFELRITADEFISNNEDNYKRLAVATNNLYKKYINFHDLNYGFQIRLLQKVEIDLEQKIVSIQWADDFFKNLDLLKSTLEIVLNKHYKRN